MIPVAGPGEPKRRRFDFGADRRGNGWEYKERKDTYTLEKNEAMAGRQSEIEAVEKK